jgi:hypothetical protein
MREKDLGRGMLAVLSTGNPVYEEFENRFFRLAGKADVMLGYPRALVLAVFFVFVG